MSAGTHTPGPWFWRGLPRGGGSFLRARDEAVAYVVKSGMPNEADCRLIAAAPDLLEACESVIAAHDAVGTCNSGNKCILHGLRAAIAKARGIAPPAAAEGAP